MTILREIHSQPAGPLYTVSVVIVMTGAPQTNGCSCRPHVGFAGQIPVGNAP
jgi:hypothetical protein